MSNTMQQHRMTVFEDCPSVVIPLEHESVLTPHAAGHEFSAVTRRIEQDLPAINEFYSSVEPLLYWAQLNAVSKDAPEDPSAPYWDNGYFSAMDARMAYAVAGALAPRVILEVGSGNSTKFFRKAINDHRTGSVILSIDPVPRADIDKLCDRVIREDVNKVDPKLFEMLKAGDVLFWDGSHLVLNGTDPIVLFMDALPRLAPGVLVHVHDITLPYEYPSAFDGRGYAEQYMLAAYLLGGGDVEVIAPVSWLATTRGLEGGVSFWMRKK